MKHTKLVKIAEILPCEDAWVTYNNNDEKIDVDEEIKSILLPDEKKEIYNKIKEWRTSLNPVPPIRMEDPYSGVVIDNERYVLEVFLSCWKERTSFTLFKKVKK